ncbi:hypothetical protein O0L34_g10263 [Tuta absoluta]|nr:hypothetical protein O0L34_g10263 [Tuta absoluta]
MIHNRTVYILPNELLPKRYENGNGFPQSTSTTPKPPARTKKEAKETKDDPKDLKEPEKPKNLCQRLMGKCKKCCACCGKGEDDEKEMQDKKPVEEGKRGMMSRLNCCRKKDKEERDAEMAAGKAASIEFESETKRKRKLRDIMCGCCGRKRRVSDVSQLSHARFGDVARSVSDVTAPTVGETGCCGRRKETVDRRDSILSDRDNSCCNNRLFNWMRGCCRRQQPEPSNASRRQSMFSKNKSMSPTLPPEENLKTAAWRKSSKNN